MKLDELRKAIENHADDDLRLVIVELYRRIPNNVIKEKSLDELITAPRSFVRSQKKPKVVELPDPREIALDMEIFIRDAKNGYYCSPNSYIRKADRPKWRFHVKRFHRDLVALFKDPGSLNEVSRLLELLYDLLCSSAEKGLFNSADVFESIGIPKEKFYGDLVTAKRAIARDLTWIDQAMELLFRYESYSRSDAMRFLVGELTTNALREEALLVVIRTFQQKTEPRGRKLNPLNQTNDLAELALRICLSMKDYKQGLDLYWTHYVAPNKEIAVFVLLRILEEHKEMALWLQEYKAAKDAGVTLRRELVSKNALLTKG